MKPHLTPVEMIKAAYLYHVHHLHQHVICEILECSNVGRINEAIKHVEKAVGINGGGYRDRKTIRGTVDKKVPGVPA